MQQNDITLLEDRCALYIGGEDRAEFLQGIISNDINKLQNQDIIYAYFLTPQGRIISDVFISHFDKGYILDIDAQIGAELLRRLKMFKLKSRVEINSLADMKVCISQSLGLTDPRNSALGYRVYGRNIEAWDNNHDWYLQERVKNLVPDFCDMESGRSLALEVNGAVVGAIDFKKGCYVGQEVTARMWYQQKVRRRVVLLKANDYISVSIRSTVYKNDQEVGISLTNYEEYSLALLNHEMITVGDEVAVGGHTCIVQKISNAGLKE